MPNAYFRFQQFTVWQEQSAMKVCTDACVFGAWVAQRVRHPARVLDVGTGTGLIALMLAQGTDATIDAVEIDALAAEEARRNFAASPWPDRLNLTHADVLDYARTCGSGIYDAVISNPPFFDGDLRSPDSRRNLALHSTALTLDELAVCAARLLRKGGEFAVLLPHHRSAAMRAAAEAQGFSLSASLNLKQSPRHPPFRSIYLFSNIAVEATATAEIAIKDLNQNYTPEFRELMAPYYLEAGLKRP